METETPEKSRPLLTAKGCRNVIIVIVSLAVIGFAWSMGLPHDSSAGRVIASMVGATSSLILSITVYGIVVNFVAIVDWFRFRSPPVIEHPVLGTIRYVGMRWAGKAGGIPFTFEGRRPGPDPDVVEAIAHGIANCDAYVAKVRAFAVQEIPEDVTLGLPDWIGAFRAKRDRPVETDWNFVFWKTSDARLRVSFRGDEPISAERV